MSDKPRHPPPPARVPTLTEIVELAAPEVDQPMTGWPGAGPLPVLTDEADNVVADVEPATVVPAPAADGMPAAEQLVDSVMSELQQRIDVAFERQLRDALAPTLARAAEQMIGEARTALAGELRELVARAVAQELARRRGPIG